jgi:hypothetical protein
MAARRAFVLAVAAAAALSVAPGIAAAAAASTQVQLTTSEVLRQAPRNPFGVLVGVGGAVISASTGGEQQGDLHARDRVDLTGLQCSFVEKADTITMRFSAKDTLMVSAKGSDVSTDGCAGNRFHRVLAWQVVGGTGKYAGWVGNGTAVGNLRSRAAADFASSTLTWRGVLSRPAGAAVRS